jgi:dolichol-phosphate mannosyltransferase
MKTDRALSVVIACYRDAGSVRELYRRLREILPAITPNYEIIYVNDASPDSAEAILTEIAEADPHVVIINHTRNFGSQNAFLSGVRVSRGDGVILMDGDLQDPPHLIPQLVDKWLEGYHIVYGVRVRRRETLFRQVAYKAFYRLFRRMAKVSIPVDAGDFGLMDRRVIAVLLRDFPERLVFLRGLRAYTGFKHTGVPYVREPRFAGASTNSLLGNLRWAKFAIFSFSEKPLEYISFLAFLCVFLTVAASLAYLAYYFFGPRHPPSGFTTLLLAVFFLGSIQLVCLAILAVYLGHIYEEVKRRPRYIVRDIIDNRSQLASRRLSQSSPSPGDGERDAEAG